MLPSSNHWPRACSNPDVALPPAPVLNRLQLLSEASLKDSMSGNATAMAPERLLSGKVVEKGDVFSFGTVFALVVLEFLTTIPGRRVEKNIGMDVETRVAGVARARAVLVQAGAPAELGDVLVAAATVDMTLRMDSMELARRLDAIPVPPDAAARVLWSEDRWVAEEVCFATGQGPRGSLASLDLETVEVCLFCC